MKRPKIFVLIVPPPLTAHLATPPEPTQSQPHHNSTIHNNNNCCLGCSTTTEHQPTLSLLLRYSGKVCFRHPALGRTRLYTMKGMRGLAVGCLGLLFPSYVGAGERICCCCCCVVHSVVFGFLSLAAKV